MSLVLSTCAAVLAFGVARASPAASELLVAAAADLTTVQEPLARGFERTTGQKLRFTLGASGMLTQQIEQGTPYDVFLSANEAFVSDLARSGRLEPDSVRVYAFGQLGLWSKNGSVKRLADLKDPRVLHLAIANPAHAPYGVAAREMLERLGLWKGAPAEGGLWGERPAGASIRRERERGRSDYGVVAAL